MATESNANLSTGFPSSVHSRRSLANMQEDILIQIFFILSRDTNAVREGRRAWDWIVVTKVCRYWRAIAIGNPKLWSLLDNFQNTTRFRKHIELSKDADLCVVCNVSPKQKYEKIHLRNLMIALKEMRRIEHLVLITSITKDQVAQLLPFLELPAPRMRSIVLWSSCFNLFPHIRLPSTSPGVLRSVSFGHVTLSSTMLSLAHLSRLKLRNCESSLSEFLRILEACQELEYLYLCDCNFDRSGSKSLGITMKPIHLPNLEQLYLNKVSDGFDIVQNIDAPNVLRWFVGCTGENITKADVLSRLWQREYHSEEILICIRYITGAEEHSSIKIVAQPDTTQINPGDASLHVQFKRTVESIEDVNVALKGWIKIFEDRLMETPLLYVADEFDETITVETWNGIFRYCTSAKALKIFIGTGPNSGRGCLKALAHVYDNVRYPSGHEFKMNFRNLEHLIIHAVWFGRPSQFLLLLEDALMIRSMNGFPVHKITIYSIQNLPIIEKAWMLKQWVEDIEFVDEMLESELEKDLWK